MTYWLRCKQTLLFLGQCLFGAALIGGPVFYYLLFVLLP